MTDYPNFYPAVFSAVLLIAAPVASATSYDSNPTVAQLLDRGAEFIVGNVVLVETEAREDEDGRFVVTFYTLQTAGPRVERLGFPGGVAGELSSFEPGAPVFGIGDDIAVLAKRLPDGALLPYHWDLGLFMKGEALSGQAILTNAFGREMQFAACDKLPSSPYVIDRFDPEDDGEVFVTTVGDPTLWEDFVVITASCITSHREGYSNPDQELAQ